MQNGSIPAAKTNAATISASAMSRGIVWTSAAGAAVLVIQNDEVRALRVPRAGEVTTTTLLPHTGNAVVRAFDRNGDGIEEIAMATSSGIEILERTGSTWTAVHTLAAGRSALVTIVATDLNGDHVDDLFVTFEDEAAFYIRNGSSYDPARVVEPVGSTMLPWPTSTAITIRT